MTEYTFHLYRLNDKAGTASSNHLAKPGETWTYDASATSSGTITVDEGAGKDNEDDPYFTDYETTTWDDGTKIPGRSRDFGQDVTDSRDIYTPAGGTSATSVWNTGEEAQPGLRWDLEYTDPETGETKTVIVLELYNPDGGGYSGWFASTEPLIDGVTYTVTKYSGYAGAPYSELVVCFARGTLIETDHGLAVIESMAAGDRVLTKDNGYQEIRWIGSRKLVASELEAFPNLRPILIRSGVLGKNKPESDLFVSPQHRILVCSKIAQRMFGTDEVLVAAKQLLEIDGIDIAEDIKEIEYFHILFDRHEIVFANGAETESLHTGPQALKSISAAAREEIFHLFPELQNSNTAMIRASVRPLISGRRARQLAIRHKKHNRELVS